MHLINIGMKIIIEKKWSLWLLILLIFISGNLEAQDYVESQVGELTYGRIVASFDYSDYKYIDFESEEGKVTRYTPGEIAGFGLENGRRFVSKDLPKENHTVFVQKVFSGTISMYRYQGRFFLEKDLEIHHLNSVKFITEVGGKKAMASRKSYIGILNRFMAGRCGFELKTLIDGTKLQQEDLVSLLKAFHDCENLPYEVPGEDVPLFKASPFFMVGAGNLGLSPVKRTTGRMDSFENPILPYAFLGVRIHSFKHSPRLFYDLGLGVTAQKNSIYAAFHQHQGITITGREDFSIVSGFLPITANYIINRNSINEFYLGAGVTVMFSQTRYNFAMIDFKERAVKFERESDIHLMERSFFTSRNLNGAPHIKMGSNFFLNQKLNFVIEAKTELFPNQYNLVLLYNYSRYNLLFSTVSFGFRF
jgi:hypothetical protein